MQFKRLLTVLPLLLMLKAREGTGLTTQGFIRNALSDTLSKTRFTQYEIDNLSDGGIEIFENRFSIFLPHSVFQYLRSNNPSYTISEMIKCYKNLHALLSYQRDGTRARYRLQIDIAKFRVPSDTSEDLILGLQCRLFSQYLLKILLDYDKLLAHSVSVSKRIDLFLINEVAIAKELSEFLNRFVTVEKLDKDGIHPDLCMSDFSYGVYT